MTQTVDGRKQAWVTRRAKYGPQGHNSGYGRGGRARTSLGVLALKLVVRLQADGTLSEGQCCKALDLDRVDWRAVCDATEPLPAPPAVKED